MSETENYLRAIHVGKDPLIRALTAAVRAVLREHTDENGWCTGDHDSEVGAPWPCGTVEAMDQAIREER